MGSTWDRWAPDFSPSQVETFLVCPRQWGWWRIAGLDREDSDAGEVGDASHDQLETYLHGGQLDFTQLVHGVRIADRIQAGLHLLPDPEELANVPGFATERKFRFTTSSGLTFNGRKDLVVPDGALFPQVENEPDVGAGEPVVSDHKTSGNLNWAKEPEDLDWDVQAITYAEEELRNKPEANAVDCVWTYFQTKGPKRAIRVYRRLPRQHVHYAFSFVEEIASTMADLLKRGKVAEDKSKFVLEQLRHNAKACDRFMGCPYQGECNLSNEERLAGKMSDGFFASLQSMADAADGKVTIQDKPVTQVMGVSDKDVPAATEASCVFFAPQPVNPPESLLPPPVLPPAIQAALASDDDEGGDAPAQEAAAAAATAPAPEAPKQRGSRKPGSKNKPKENTLAEVIQALVSEDPFAGLGLPKKSPIGTLLVDAIIVPQADGAPPVVQAEKLVAEANTIIGQQFKTDDGQPIAHYRFIPFGKSQGALEVALEQVVLATGHMAFVAVSSQSDALPVLTRLSSMVIRGVR